MFCYDSVNSSLKSTIISFLSPAEGKLDAGTFFKIFSKRILEISKSSNSIVIPKILVFGTYLLYLIFSGEQLTKISAKVDSPTRLNSVLKILTVSECLTYSKYPLKSLICYFSYLLEAG